MIKRAWGEEYRTTTVCIDSYQDGAMKGRFYNPYLEGGRGFDNLTQFLFHMEQTLDLMDFPKAFTAIRTFVPPPKVGTTGPPDDQWQTGKLATFKLRILFRQNASWQGSITWQEGRREQSFRSVLELILLMNTAINQEKAS